MQDYTWKQNRLSKDKEALKNSVLNVIKKKPKGDENQKDMNIKQLNVNMAKNENVQHNHGM